MALFIDSAKVKEVRQAVPLGFVAGVTTNPSLPVEIGRPGLEVWRDILGITAGPVFYQAIADTVLGRAEQALAADQEAPGRMVVRIPATTENLALTSRLAADGIPCCVAAVSHPAQAYPSALAGGPLYRSLCKPSDKSIGRRHWRGPRLRGYGKGHSHQSSGGQPSGRG